MTAVVIFLMWKGRKKTKRESDEDCHKINSVERNDVKSNAKHDGKTEVKNSGKSGGKSLQPSVHIPVKRKQEIQVRISRYF